jgi:hypothetical protein
MVVLLIINWIQVAMISRPKLDEYMRVPAKESVKYFFKQNLNELG